MEAPRSPARRVRLAAAERRRLIVDAALEALSERGFEGLRTRDVAALVKINSATLHHYFPTKEDLITGIAERLQERLGVEKAPSLVGSGALTALRQQFADALFYARRRPRLVAVYRELAARAWRDPAIRRLVARLNRGWRRSIEGIVRRGIAEGRFRADVDPAAAATAVMAAIWGFLVLLDLPPAAFRRSCAEIERGLLAHPHGGRK